MTGKKIEAHHENEKRMGKEIKDPAPGSIAIVQVRGVAKTPYPIKDTLRLLGLRGKNCCVLREASPVIIGMARKSKDYVTWGEVSPETIAELVARRGREFLGRLQDSKKKYKYNCLTFGKRQYLPYFCLNPPRKGFGRKGIKVAYAAGGALGYRGEKINDLLKRMM